MELEKAVHMSTFSTELTSLEGRYAKALYEATMENQDVSSTKIQNILDEAKDFFLLLDDQKDLAVTLMTPLVSHKIQLRVLKRVLKAFNFSKEFTTFVYLILEHGRITSFKKIVEALTRLYMRETHVIPVKVMTATPLKTDTLKRINTLLNSYFNDKLQLVIEIHPSLISGFRIETPEKVFDASFKKQLRLIQHELSPTPN